jgi:hemerythrin
MRSLKWSTSHAVFVAEIDDEHKEIFEALASLKDAVDSGNERVEAKKWTDRVIACTAGHFEHEERLMRASRYDSFQWHKQQHDYVRRRMRRYAHGIESGISEATTFVEYLAAWLPNHARIADRMMGAFLRNQRRACRITFLAGTKPPEACDWIDSTGEKFNPIENGEES